MNERAQDLMNKVWEEAKTEEITEEKLVSFILRQTAEIVTFYTAQDGRIVLDKNDLLQLANEVGN